MVKKLKNKRKKFSVGGFTGATTADIKQNKFIPGTGIEISSRERLKEEMPDYILILAHNFSDYIIKSLSNIYKGKYIVRCP